jgi:hypothetical protein
MKDAGRHRISRDSGTRRIDYSRQSRLREFDHGCIDRNRKAYRQMIELACGVRCIGHGKLLFGGRLDRASVVAIACAPDPPDREIIPSAELVRSRPTRPNGPQGA